MIQTLPPTPIWTNLEIVKLLVSALTPLMILFVGVWVARLAERFKAALWVNQKVIEKRIALYDELAPLLNDLFCYYYFVGGWREFTPPQVLEFKRTLDRRMNIYAPLFSPELKQRYDEFIEHCFLTYQQGVPAKLRTSLGDNEDRKKFLAFKWNDDWDKMFTGEHRGHAGNILKTYENLMSCFAIELGVGLRQQPSPEAG